MIFAGANVGAYHERGMQLQWGGGAFSLEIIFAKRLKHRPANELSPPGQLAYGR